MSKWLTALRCKLGTFYYRKMDGKSYRRFLVSKADWMFFYTQQMTIITQQLILKTSSWCENHFEDRKKTRRAQRTYIFYHRHIMVLHEGIQNGRHEKDVHKEVAHYLFLASIQSQYSCHILCHYPSCVSNKELLLLRQWHRLTLLKLGLMGLGLPSRNWLG